MIPRFSTPLVCIVGLVAAVPQFGVAQLGRPPIVSKIDVQYAGPATLSQDRIIANMRTRVGKPYSEQLIEDDIRNLYATGNVENVRIFGEPIGNEEVRVIVMLQTKAVVGSVEFEGVSAVSVSRLRGKISSKPGDAANESTLEADRQAVLEYYRTKGFTDVEVQVKSETNEQQGSTRVRFVVREGGKSAIRSIQFQGNSKISSRELRGVVKTRKYLPLWSAIVKTGRVSSDLLSEDVQTLREFYHNRGFSDVQIGAPSLKTVGGKVDVTFPIREGEVYRISKISFVGARLFTEDKLLAATKLREGSVYSPAAIQADIKALQELYGAKGYVDFQAVSRPTSGGKNFTQLTISLDEGTQSTVGRVNISGNTRTKDKVIRRELALAPGDIFNTVRMDASKQRLNNLNYFSKVDVYPAETGMGDARDLNVVLEEKRTGSLNFGAGFSSIDSLLGFVEVTQGNFDIARWPYFTGGGQKFRSRVQYGAQRRDASISLTEPYFLDRKLSLGGEAFYHEASFVSDVYSERRFGFELIGRKPITEFSFARFGYRIEQIGVQGVTSDAPPFIRSQQGDRSKSQLFAGVTYDSRDSLFLTRKGERVDLSGFVAGGPLGGSIQTYGWNLEGSKYFKFAWDTILTLNAQLGLVENWGDGVEVPIFDRLFLGGNDVRGFQFRRVGGKGVVREGNEPLGGKSLGRMTVEYTLPVMDKVRFATFYDAGFVNEKAYDFSTSGYNSNVGLGLRLDLPIGPVRIDYGIPTKQYPGDNASGRFNFNVGYQF
jgi:outer membrane protein insertion porin family